MKILILVPYPKGEAPSQRFRFEQYLELLEKSEVAYDFQSFLDARTWHILYQSEHHLEKVYGIIKGFFSRFFLAFNLRKYHYIFIHREASPIGPPIFEWIIAKVWRKKIIYDFDDAIWLPNTSQQNKIVAGIKWHSKVAAICKWSYKVSAGNEYLANYARQFNSNVVINPTTIDTENLHKPEGKEKRDHLVIGWTGTHSTIKYLDELLPILDKVAKKFSFKLLVISNQPPNFQRGYLDFIAWNKTTEIADLQKMDVGIMPLTDDPWAKGKCGFKALQYMALKIPAIVSPVGVNVKIVDHGINGFICESDEEWEEAIISFLKNPKLIETMAVACREKIIEDYSVLSNQENFLSLFS